MINEHHQPYPLRSADASKFIREELHWAEMALCDLLLSIDLEAGRSITYQPSKTVETTLYEFTGLPTNTSYTYKTLLETYGPTREAMLSGLAEHHINTHTLNYVVGCHNLSKPTDPYLETEFHPIFFHEQSVYFFRHSADSHEQPIAGRKFHRGSRPGISILTSIDADLHPLHNRNHVSVETIASLAMHVRFIVINVYDDTGYLYWCRAGEPYPHELLT